MNITTVTKNRFLTEQKINANSVLHQATKNQKAVVEKCIELSYLEGIKVGLEEAKKIYRFNDKNNQ
jgi:hypothetical protein